MSLRAELQNVLVDNAEIQRAAKEAAEQLAVIRARAERNSDAIRSILAGLSEVPGVLANGDSHEDDEKTH